MLFDPNKHTAVSDKLRAFTGNLVCDIPTVLTKDISMLQRRKPRLKSTVVKVHKTEAHIRRFAACVNPTLIQNSRCACLRWTQRMQGWKIVEFLVSIGVAFVD